MKRIAVIGAGTMGNGIAHIFAMKGFDVSLIDVSQESLDKGMSTISRNMDRMIAKEKITEKEKVDAISSIKTFTSYVGNISDADLVIEAATENESLKFKIFSELDVNAPKDCILATNTSSISITKIAAQTSRPDQVIGMHFMNPVPIMKLVEVIRGYDTSDQVTKTIMNLSKELGKMPVEVNDYPGFVANRILMPMINEAIYTLHENVAGVKEIDEVMKLGMAHPMGPLQLADFIGLDVCLAILKVLQDGFGLAKYAPCPLLVNMVASGNIGRKTGRGFYDYSHQGKELILAENFS